MAVAVRLAVAVRAVRLAAETSKVALLYAANKRCS